MRIGKSAYRSTAISASNAERIIVRGHDLSAELIGQTTLTEFFALLVGGHIPDAASLKILDAAMVAISEHGLVPSIQVARMTLASAPEALQAAVAAGVLGCGSVILGSAESAGALLEEVNAVAQGGDLRAAADSVLGQYRVARRPVPGFGHPQHKDRDPRADRLIALARELGTAGRHVAIAEVVETAIPSIYQRTLALNVSGAIPAILLDIGMPLQAIKGVAILARTASLVAHLVEERSRPIGFVLSEHASRAITYDGIAPDGFVAE